MFSLPLLYMTLACAGQEQGGGGVKLKISVNEKLPKIPIMFPLHLCLVCMAQNTFEVTVEVCIY
jgi:hypothetical protein